MTTIFMEPGGDATYDFSLWSAIASPSIATDFVHGGHIKSFKVLKDGSQSYARFNTTSLTGRLSCYVYFNALPGADAQFINIYRSSAGVGVDLRISSAGVLKLFDTFTPAQLGSNGATLSTGIWYRITICWNITSATVNEFRVYVNGGAASISVTNGTIVGGTVNNIRFGNSSGDTTLDHRFSDIYIDDSSSANDIATDVWVTAKRPVSNGSANNFTTQIGVGGSGYGTGHSPQVNERPLSTTNGWSMVGSGSAVTEEYTVEGASVGDIDISSATLIDYMGWVYASSLASETASIVVGGASSNISLTSSNTAFLKAKGATTYPAGGTDIGIITSTDLTTVSLYECGLMFTYTPGLPGPPPNLNNMNTSMQSNA